MNSPYILSAILVVLVVGCNRTAPPIKRVINSPLDERYLKEVCIPSIGDERVRSLLSNSAGQLDLHLAEFRSVIRPVELGKVAVRKNMKGGWQSNLDDKDYLRGLSYYGEVGLISQFDKCWNRDPYSLIYGFEFYTNGILWSADTMEDSFQFDGLGRVVTWQHKTTNACASIRAENVGNFVWEYTNSDSLRGNQ